MSDLARFAGTVNPEGKALLLQAASMLAAADGNLAAEEEELIFTIGESLGLPDRSTREIVLATLSPDQESD
jgi:tellurite resistance protein